MTIIRVQVSLPRDNNIPADVIMNTWHFRTVGLTSPLDVATDAVDQLGVFYAEVDTLLAAYVASPITFKAYDLSDEEPRVPIYDASLAITPGSGVAFPAEVAIALSYRGALLSGANPARRRGRIFLGPIDEGSGTTGADDVRVADGARNTIVGAAETLAGNELAGDAQWVVFSPTTAGSPPWSVGTLEDSSVDVVAGYVDNAFDTIRSRGSLSNVRTTFELVVV